MRDADQLRLLVVGVATPLETFLTRLFTRLVTEGVDVAIAVRREYVKQVPQPLRAVPLPAGHPGWAAVRLAVRTSGTRRREFRRKLEIDALLRAHADVIYFPWNA